VIAVVPARGGSKGLPRKNTLPLAGPPLIVHTLNAALGAESISRIIVTTDDPEIMDICSAVPGVDVPFQRPAHLAEDETSAVDVFFHLLDWLEIEDRTGVESFCVLQPTSLLRLPEDIDGAVRMFGETDALAVLSVTESKPLPWHYYLQPDGRMAPLEQGEDSANPMDMRQKMSELVVQNGAVHIFDVAGLRKTRSYYGPKTFGYMMPAIRSVDIDDAMDFSIAEALMNARA
jgi:CMP-N,N'-diacetyllegionaminic acid synthase